ncbi:MAG: MotE family protein [Alphaproteobacteria bacterium]
MLKRIRLLPVTIVAALLLLTVKVGHVWHGADALLGSVAAQGAEDAAAGDAGVAAPAERIDVTNISPAEVELLENLAGRREELEARAREIDMREKLLAATERRIDGKIDELKKMQATMEALFEEFDEKEESKIRSLVKIYERMKPKDAARIFNQLDMNVLLEVVERMREVKAAPILAEMESAKAKAITIELARRRPVPNLATSTK